jgi:hypothetical protein
MKRKKERKKERKKHTTLSSSQDGNHDTCPSFPSNAEIYNRGAERSATGIQSEGAYWILWSRFVAGVEVVVTLLRGCSPIHSDRRWGRRT